MSLVFHSKTSKDGQFYFTLQHDGKMLAKSEMYKQNASCKNGIESVKKHSQERKYFVVETASSGKIFFNLKASNGQIIATSAMFDDETACEKNIDLCVQSAKDAVVEVI